MKRAKPPALRRKARSALDRGGGNHAIPAARALPAGAVEELRCTLRVVRIESNDAARDDLLDELDGVSLERTAVELEPGD